MSSLTPPARRSGSPSWNVAATRKNTGVPAGISDAGIGLTGHPSTMIDELIDLTTMQPSKVLRTRFTPTDLMWIVVVGGVPYLAREAFRYLFPRRPTVVDQLKVLVELIAAAGEAKAKSLKVRISTAAKTRWEMPESIQEADLEIVFRVSINPRRSQPLMAQLGSDERSLGFPLRRARRTQRECCSDRRS